MKTLRICVISAQFMAIARSFNPYYIHRSDLACLIRNSIEIRQHLLLIWNCDIQPIQFRTCF